MHVRMWQTTGRELFLFTLLMGGKKPNHKQVRRQLMYNLFKPEVILVASFTINIVRPRICNRVVREQE